MHPLSSGSHYNNQCLPFFFLCTLSLPNQLVHITFIYTCIYICISIYTCIKKEFSHATAQSLSKVVHCHIVSFTCNVFRILNHCVLWVCVTRVNVNCTKRDTYIISIESRENFISDIPPINHHFT